MQPVHTAYRPMEEELRALREFRKEAVTPWEKGESICPIHTEYTEGFYELDLSQEIKGRAVLCRFYKKWDVIL